MICRDQVSDLCRNCDPIHALLRLLSTPCTSCVCLLTDVTVGILRMMSEQIVVSSWLGTDDTVLALGIHCLSLSSCIGDLREKFLCNTLFFDNITLGVTPLAFGIEEGASCTFNRSVHGCDRSSMVSSSSCSRSKSSFGCRKFCGWYCLLFGNCNHGEEVFDAAFDHVLTF